MNQDIVVQFEHVSKKFSLHRKSANSFLELVVGLFQHTPSANSDLKRENFWALQDVSFVIRRGETVGIIGPNGAGKSTALKLLTRIIEPTSGRVVIHGRVGALLELGAGFHPDLTGRENIYLNGSILGLSRAEIGAKLEEIIAFAELERFIDMPVKHYSSGMYVRLGFSVAVNTEPEVLLVDEVLSVGDAAFQRKCMERISDMRRDGVTIILVSHGLDTVQQFCHEAIWLDSGKLQAQGNVTDIAMDYTAAMAKKHTSSGHRAPAQTSETAAENPRRWGAGRIQITNVALYDGNKQPETTFATGDPLEIRLHYHAAERVVAPVFGIAIHHQNGTHICGPNTQQLGYDIPAVEGAGVVCYRIPALNLLEGSYLISAAVVNETGAETFDYHDRMYPFRVYRGKCREVYGLVSLQGAWDIADGDELWSNN